MDYISQTRNFTSDIKVNLEVMQPAWGDVLNFLNKHVDCASPIQMWFHAVPQCNGKFKLYMQLYCDICHHKLIPYPMNNASNTTKKED